MFFRDQSVPVCISLQIPAEIILIWIHICVRDTAVCRALSLSPSFPHTHTHAQAGWANTHNASAFCIHLLQRWWSNEPENTQRSHEEVCRGERLQGESIRWETAHSVELSNDTDVRTRSKKKKKTDKEERRQEPSYRGRGTCCVGTCWRFWERLGSECQTSFHSLWISPGDTLQRKEEFLKCV